VVEDYGEKYTKGLRNWTGNIVDSGRLAALWPEEKRKRKEGKEKKYVFIICFFFSQDESER
jgi:hypothetical protein